MKKVIIILFLLICSITGYSQTVHYTRTGAKYHAAGCQYLRKSDFSCSLTEALSRGLGPCSRCNPPTKVQNEKIKRVEPKKPSVKKTSYLIKYKYNKTSLASKYNYLALQQQI